jgi:transcriptional regulator with XRE-family HTH domain
LNTLERIRKLLDDRNWSMYKLSKLSGVSQSTLSNMFSRNNDPSISTLEDICKAFGITLSQFFANDGELVVLTKEQSEMLEKWSTLSDEQKSALLKLLK